jgi:hypothetical protein
MQSQRKKERRELSKRKSLKEKPRREDTKEAAKVCVICV